MSRRSLNIFWAVLAAALLALAPRGARAQEAPLEYRLKAAIAYHLVQFTEWPADAFPDPKGPIVVALVGDDVFRGALAKAVEGKAVRDRALVYRHFASAEAVGACHVLFVSPSEAGRLGAVFERVRGKAVLTIGDAPRFTAEGGMVRLYLEDKRIRFEVRLKAAQREGLRISAQLLKMARIFEE